MNIYRYQVGGSLSSNAPTYVERSADTEIYQALKQGEFCYVLNSRQMGKSSLLVRTKHRLQEEGFKCVAIDLTNIGSENITAAQWYKGIAADLCSEFKLGAKFNFKSWWKEQEEISFVQRLSYLLEELLIEQFPTDNLVIFIDETDTVLSLDFNIDDFFALIRYCYNQRAINPAYDRITFAIFGVATPADLIQDKNRTPFNIGKAIELHGFQLEEAMILTKGLAIEGGNPQTILAEILAWTGGQPFLTQKLCQLLLNSSQDPLRKELTIPPGTEAFWVENAIKLRLIHQWESQDEPEHLRTIRNRLLANEKIAGCLLETYQQILRGEEVLTDDSREKIELLLSGLAISKQGKLKVKNRIYETVFNSEWVTKQLENLRPYAQNFQAWLASTQQDESQLLKGMVLKEALAWAENKKLSSLDYRFLAASQELAKREIESDLAAEKQARQTEREKAQFALQAAKQAHEILAQARKTAKQKSQNLYLGKLWIAFIATTIAGSVILLRLTGLLQGIEWNILDKFFQARPPDGIDPRIVIIKIEESDIQQIGHYPISDRILVKALQILKSYQPRAIGLDLYRDLPVEPGYQELVKLFKNTPNLIGVEKVVGSKVAPPPVLAELDQVGFADQVLDGDGKVRRALLSAQPSNDKIHFNLGLKLALIYLKAEGITPQGNSKISRQVRLGKAELFPFQTNDGSYVKADAGGYQILLNFHGPQAQFQTFSFRELLANQIPKELVRDRIVLIGSTAESINDFFQTPYSSRLFGAPKLMAGVMLHANLSSQILSAALEGRPMLRVWPKGFEWLWILFWSSAGAALSWQMKAPKKIIVIVMITALGITIISYQCFLYGWWIPVISPMIALILSAIILPIVTIKQLEKIELEQTVKLLIVITQTQPAAGLIAIEYLKQAESQENQALIEQILQKWEMGS